MAISNPLQFAFAVDRPVQHKAQDLYGELARGMDGKVQQLDMARGDRLSSHIPDDRTVRKSRVSALVS